MAHLRTGGELMHGDETHNPNACYVCGFMFDRELKRVVLIQKQKPEWQRGRLNGVGGKIEESESSEAAMSREFVEETGVAVHEYNWTKFCTLKGADDRHWFVDFFYVRFDYVDAVVSKTDEQVVVYPVDDLMRGQYFYVLPRTSLRFGGREQIKVDAVVTKAELLPNIRWLIQMALSFAQYGEKCKSFVVQEQL